MTEDPGTDRVRIVLPVEDDCVSSVDLLRGLARAQGFDDGALEGAISPKPLEITTAKGRRTIRALNVVLGRSVTIRVLPRGSGDEEAKVVEIVIDRRALLASQRRMKKLLRLAFLRKSDRAQREYGLHVEEGLESIPEGESLVVLIHGFQAGTESLRGMLVWVRKQGHFAATFDYPNDQPLADSGRALADELKRLARERPDLSLVLLTRSMGGLVAREAVENPRLDPGNVRQLILVSPPNHGSQLAYLGFAGEVWEHAGTREEKEAAQRFFESVEDGLGEAAVDLRPDSYFLKALNARPRNPRVKYTILLGRSAPLDEFALERMRESIRDAGGRNRLVRFLGPRLQEILADLDEVVRGKGDGAVAVERGRLEGVSDTVILDFGHLDEWAVSTDSGCARLRAEIARRLADSLEIRAKRSAKRRPLPLQKQGANESLEVPR